VDLYLESNRKATREVAEEKTKSVSKSRGKENTIECFLILLLDPGLVRGKETRQINQIRLELELPRVSVVLFVERNIRPIAWRRRSKKSLRNRSTPIRTTQE
jgi:hypothetical protein